MARTKQTKRPVTNSKAPPKKAALKGKKQTVRQIRSTIEKALIPAKAEPAVGKNNAQVDSHVPGATSATVVVDGGVACSAYLNWSDLKNNHNKFYIVQVLQQKGKTGPAHNASVYIRYGRVGLDGVSSMIGMDYSKALKEFHKTTRKKMSKGYTLIMMADKASDKDAVAGGVVG